MLSLSRDAYVSRFIQFCYKQLIFCDKTKILLLQSLYLFLSTYKNWIVQQLVMQMRGKSFRGQCFSTQPWGVGTDLRSAASRLDESASLDGCPSTQLVTAPYGSGA